MYDVAIFHVLNISVWNFYFKHLNFFDYNYFFTQNIKAESMGYPIVVDYDLKSLTTIINSVPVALNIILFYALKFPFHKCL